GGGVAMDVETRFGGAVGAGAPRGAEAAGSSSGSLRATVLALWPEAPIDAESGTDRWLRFDRHPFGVVYLQRYGSDEGVRSHFLVVACDRAGRVDQVKHPSIGEAV